MRLSFALPSLIVLAFAGSTHATLDKAHESTRLSPINVADFEKAFGIHRRAVDDYSHLEPSSKARMVFGRPSSMPVQSSCS